MAHRGRRIDVKQWSQLSGWSLSTATDQTNGGSTLAFSSPSTILRIRGGWWAAMDATKQVDDDISVTVCIGTSSTDAATVGAASLPDPNEEPEYPWLYWKNTRLFSQIAAGNEAWGTSAQFFDIDTRAMRKMRPGQSLNFYSQTAGATGAPVTQIEGLRCRVLIGSG